MINLTKKELDIIEEALYHEVKTLEFFRGFNPIMKNKEMLIRELMKKIEQYKNEGAENEG